MDISHLFIHPFIEGLFPPLTIVNRNALMSISIQACVLVHFHFWEVYMLEWNCLSCGDSCLTFRGIMKFFFNYKIFQMFLFTFKDEEGKGREKHRLQARMCSDWELNRSVR